MATICAAAKLTWTAHQGGTLHARPKGTYSKRLSPDRLSLAQKKFVQDSGSEKRFISIFFLSQRHAAPKPNQLCGSKHTILSQLPDIFPVTAKCQAQAFRSCCRCLCAWEPAEYSSRGSGEQAGLEGTEMQLSPTVLIGCSNVLDKAFASLEALNAVLRNV